MKSISIIVPVHNEEKYLSPFLDSLFSTLQKSSAISQVIVINDGSKDKSLEILHEYQKKSKKLHIVTNKKNIGKGASIRKGIEEAKMFKSNAVIFMDGDGQHNPKHLDSFIRNLDKYAVVFGYRELEKEAPLIRKSGNEIASFIIRHIFKIDRIGDILCGYFALRKDVYDQIKWQSNDYGVEAEISAIVGRKHIPFTEIKVDTIYLDRTKGVNIFHAMLILLRIPYWILRHTKAIV